jgi:lipopolysaccharide transport system permease protein
MLNNFWKNRDLVAQLWMRDFSMRYKGGLLGIGWALINPIIMLTLYSFVFVTVFKMRWTSGPDVKGNFVILLFTGLIVHAVFAEFISRAPSLVTSNVAYVRKIVFPLEFLPLMPLFGAVINFAMNLVLVLLLLFYLQGSIPITVLLTPLILAPYLLLLLAMAYFLSATGVYIRDLTQLVGVATTVGLFASPVLYPLDIVPEPYRTLLYLNPLTLVVEQLRRVAVVGSLPDWGQLAVYTAVSFAVFWLSVAWFQKTRSGFADVL